MAKKKKLYICTACGNEFTKWNGQCSICNEWNSLVEIESNQKKTDSLPTSILLSNVTIEHLERIKLKNNEFNLVCGGGIVQGSVILIGGDPGIGKSTLGLQIAGEINSLYVSGEESLAQIKGRGQRIKANLSNIKVSNSRAVEDIIHLIKKEKAKSVIIDSIQTIFSKELSGSPGTVAQVKESASQLVDFAKKNSVTVILIGHITKEGNIAGPKLLEHLVDTVLYFEGDFHKDFRILRSFKNRFGSVNEIGLFRMTEKGLIEVSERSKVFLNSFGTNSAGNAISAELEGSRIMVFEVQSLVVYSNFTNPKRLSDGFDFNRLNLMCAVLEKHSGLKLNSFDVFINVSGGFKINETSADLAVSMAIASSFKNKPLPPKTAFLGEISLSGDIRPVTQINRRIIELKNNGIDKIVLSKFDMEEIKSIKFTGEIFAVATISEAIKLFF